MHYPIGFEYCEWSGHNFHVQRLAVSGCVWLCLSQRHQIETRGTCRTCRTSWGPWATSMVTRCYHGFLRNPPEKKKTRPEKKNKKTLTRWTWWTYLVFLIVLDTWGLQAPSMSFSWMILRTVAVTRISMLRRASGGIPRLNHSYALSTISIY